jgi:hypothetical protein
MINLILKYLCTSWYSAKCMFWSYSICTANVKLNTRELKVISIDGSSMQEHRAVLLINFKLNSITSICKDSCYQAKSIIRLDRQMFTIKFSRCGLRSNVDRWLVTASAMIRNSSPVIWSMNLKREKTSQTLLSHNLQTKWFARHEFLYEILTACFGHSISPRWFP